MSYLGHLQTSGLKTESNLNTFLEDTWPLTMSSPSLADSKSMAVEAPSAISSAFSGRHRQNTLILPKQNVSCC